MNLASLILISVFAFNSTVALSYPCKFLSDAFSSSVLENFQGHKTDHRLLSDLYPNASIRFLGAGQMGGEVYRVSPNDNGLTFVVKLYDSKASLQNDVSAQAVYEKAFSGKKTFEVAGFETISETMIKIQDVQGVTLENLLQSGGMTIVMRDALLEKYQQYLEVAESSLRQWLAAHPTAKASADGDFVRFIGWEQNRLKGKIEIDQQAVDFLIKPDNIIVTADGRMVIIDPY